MTVLRRFSNAWKTEMPAMSSEAAVESSISWWVLSVGRAK
ncbi:hypothetical protein SAZ_05230 [Streptomyces noursei ZPM]|nr:hypothetical protein SAZ_05230 [Streptomyces noursei ZPM]EPY93283.1 hypothetical protein K530_48845 [Streptomyces noursei CCRC 11814]